MKKKKPQKTKKTPKKINSTVSPWMQRITRITLAIFFVNLALAGLMVYFIRGIHKNTLVDLYDSGKTIPEFPLLKNKDFQISANAAIIFEKDSRVVVYEKEGNFRFVPASTTKIMTAVIALENYNLDQYVYIPYSVQSVEGSSMGLIGGEKVRVIDLLYGMMLPSGNDAAYVLAALDAQGRNGFVEKMNKKAQELKLYNTHFVDPSGYDDKNYTSAFDLARLAAYAMENPTFAQIVQTRHMVVHDESGKMVYDLHNLNRLLEYQDVIGIKTGFTEEAGEVLVTSLKSNGKTYIIVVLKSGDRFGDTEQILEKIRSAITLISY